MYVTIASVGRGLFSCVIRHTRGSGLRACEGRALNPKDLVQLVRAEAEREKGDPKEPGAPLAEQSVV